MAVLRPVSDDLATARPSQSADLTGQQGSQPVPPWVQFFIAMWTRTGKGPGIDAAALASDVSGLDTLETLSGAPQPTPLPPLPLPITPGGSPFSYQAPFDGVVLIAGGTVSAVTFSRDGTTTFAYPNAGEVRVTQGDVVKVTYSGVPTMTMIGHR